jgi:CheY-like chemotaxis protein
VLSFNNKFSLVAGSAHVPKRHMAVFARSAPVGLVPRTAGYSTPFGHSLARSDALPVIATRHGRCVSPQGQLPGGVRRTWPNDTAISSAARSSASNMDEIIRQSLAGKRFALMGFEAAEGESIIAMLGSVRGIGHVVGATPNIPALNTFTPFDACFVNASAVAVGEQPAPIEMIARSRKPAVVVGTVDELITRLALLADLNRDFIMRPCQAEELLLRTYRILMFIETAVAALPAAVRNGNRRVVLADDDATTVVMISTILKHFHFECDIAHDGVQAFEIARNKRPDLVLLDVSMPRMNGFEALTALRSDLATRNTRIILVSAHHDEAEVVKGFSLGADDYITKPFNSGELMARINRVLREDEDQ